MTSATICRLRILIALGLLGLASAGAQTTFVWSVVPQFPATTIHRDWTPLLARLETMTGHRFKLKTYDLISDFEVGFLRGEPDFAYMNPYHAIMAKNAQGYETIVRNGEILLIGILVTRTDSGIDSVEDLRGRRIAFPSPNAFAAALYMRALLRESEGIDFTPVYVGTHSNAFRQTLRGRTAATGTVRRAWAKETDEVRSTLKVIYETPGRAPHPIAVHERVPAAIRQAVLEAILELDKTSEGRALLEPVFLSPAVEAVYERDYLPLHSLNLDKYVVHRE